MGKERNCCLPAMISLWEKLQIERQWNNSCCELTTALDEIETMDVEIKYPPLSLFFHHRTNRNRRMCTDRLNISILGGFEQKSKFK